MSSGIGSKRVEQITTGEQPLEQLMATFLSDRTHANKMADTEKRQQRLSSQ